jgi:hypothetical protein
LRRSAPVQSALYYQVGMFVPDLAILAGVGFAALATALSAVVGVVTAAKTTRPSKDRHHVRLELDGKMQDFGYLGSEEAERAVSLAFPKETSPIEAAAHTTGPS